MRRAFVALLVLATVGCVGEQAPPLDPVSVWCSKLVECGEPSDAAQVQTWCERQARLEAPQTTPDCLDAVEGETCEAFASGMPSACR
jgi:hypothetical protein